MADSSRLGPWVRRFLLEHLIKERNLSRGTQQSYRDTLTLLIPFVARKVHRGVDAMEVIHRKWDQSWHCPRSVDRTPLRTASRLKQPESRALHFCSAPGSPCPNCAHLHGVAPPIRSPKSTRSLELPERFGFRLGMPPALAAQNFR
jgi:hypothetical protein